LGRCASELQRTNQKKKGAKKKDLASRPSSKERRFSTAIEEPQPAIGYSLKTHQFGTADRKVLVAEIRLYANAHTPTYHVVVGDVVGREKVEKVKKKLEASYSVDIPDQCDFTREPSDEFHWMPRVWPMPFFGSGVELHRQRSR
jgi:hypothetical protein